MRGSRTLLPAETDLSTLDPVHARRRMLCILVSGAGRPRLLGLPQPTVKRDA